jgi:hypothetical protein
MLKVDKYGTEFLVNMWLANAFLIIWIYETSTTTVRQPLNGTHVQEINVCWRFKGVIYENNQQDATV